VQLSKNDQVELFWAFGGSSGPIGEFINAIGTLHGGLNVPPEDLAAADHR